MTGGLTVADLLDEQAARSSMNRQTYKHLLQCCHDQIRQRAAYNVKIMEFRIPPVVPGRPPFKQERAARYICDKLRHGGFQADAIGPGVLLVDWSRSRPTAVQVAESLRAPAVSASARPRRRGLRVPSPLRRLLS